MCVLKRRVCPGKTRVISPSFNSLTVRRKSRGPRYRGLILCWWSLSIDHYVAVEDLHWSGKWQFASEPMYPTIMDHTVLDDSHPKGGMGEIKLPDPIDVPKADGD